MADRVGLLQSREGNKVRCNVCAVRCSLSTGATGVCGTRRNDGGEIHTSVYGSVAALGVDPIEKKPVYHYRPGTRVLTLGTIGCNLLCKHCQNWVISYQTEKTAPPGATEEILPERAVHLAHEAGAVGLSWSYNDPSVWLEYVLDTALAAHDSGLYTVLCTAGYSTPEANRLLLPHIDVLRLDLKGFSDRFYRRLTDVGRLGPVLATGATAADTGVHVEVVTVLIPDENDDPSELREAARWIAGALGPDTPWHLSRFIPHARWLDRRETAIEALEHAAVIGRDAGLRYVYVSGVPGHPGESTYCRNCGEELARRRAFSFAPVGLAEGRCRRCGTPAPFVGMCSEDTAEIVAAS